MQLRGVGNEMYEAAADVTWPTALQKAFVLIRRKSRLQNSKSYSKCISRQQSLIIIVKYYALYTLV